MLRPEALGLGVFVVAGLAVAGCVPPPHISTLYTGPGVPTPRPAAAAVEVFLEDHPPERAYTVLGEVQITTDRSDLSVRQMLDSAKAEARRLGGDALVGQIMVYQPHARPRRSISAEVVVWK